MKLPFIDSLPKSIRVALRILMLILITYCFGLALHYSVSKSNEGETTAGFGRGLLHGALMPGGMPSLLLGKDVVIYATNNNGRMYKLGYTMGVNVCGALFFGYTYWRINRLRRKE
ncbi:MAG: hypothetical protein SFY81_05375 [Verrucomicrobiota bacterium]|nr:hypothetical protein [Verrucomicrobiota bacterium]